jgi:hypothetical protein
MVSQTYKIDSIVDQVLLLFSVNVNKPAKILIN